MRFVRVVLTAATLLLATACVESANSAGVWVRVSPTTITAGNQTQVQASCGENANAATVSSPAFGSHTLQPVAGVLSAKVTVPATTPKGTYDVRLACPTGSQATTTLTVLGTTINGQSAPVVRGPGTGGGFLANSDDPADRTPVIWLGLGLSCLIAAAAVTLRSKGLLPVRVRGPGGPKSEPQAVRSGQPDDADQPPVPARR